jgi:hypothetical protein
MKQAILKVLALFALGSIFLSGTSTATPQSDLRTTDPMPCCEDLAR